MKLKGNTYGRFYRLFCLLMALHLFNLSIDSKDLNPDNIPEDLTFNDIESITEFVTEVVFGCLDAFQEYDEHDDNNIRAINFYKLFYSNQSVTAAHHIFSFALSSKFHIRSDDPILAPVKDIHSPPPKF
jgi:hypothetical protein